MHNLIVPINSRHYQAQNPRKSFSIVSVVAVATLNYLIRLGRFVSTVFRQFQ